MSALSAEMVVASLAAGNRNSATRTLATKLAEARRIVDVITTMLRGMADREGTRNDARPRHRK